MAHLGVTITCGKANEVGVPTTEQDLERRLQAAGVEIPYQSWVQTGDLAALKAAYPTSRALVEFMVRHTNPKVGVPTFGFYGDWNAIAPTANAAVSSFSFLLTVKRLAARKRVVN